ncbi:phage tail protein [Ferviditalea candida]|uniref:Phage tail protein n=1 Tax=Ferviditalea candida TaxID=3108399 RepID=A0ABU5ZN27_9BACL|nr:phage tail protein [Paenibacillaceae bacterium T2]
MASRIVIDTSQLNKVVKGLGEFEKQMPGAFTSAVNRTLDHVYSKTGSIVKGHYNVTSKEIKDSMEKHKATYSRPRAWIQIRSRRFTLARFLPGGLGSTSKIAKVKVKKSAGYKRVGGNPKPFVQHSPDGNTHIFRRTGKKRYPIDVLRTISPTQMVENLNVEKEIQEAANKMLEKRIDHEINYRLKKAGAK